MSQTIVQTRRIDKSQQDTFVQDFLRPCLPYSLPLLRRCQFHQRNDASNGFAEIWFAAIDDGSPLTHRPSSPWIAAHIDLTNAGQTQVWLFASWEQQFAKGDAAVDSLQNSPEYPVYQVLMSALFDHLKHSHVSKMPLTPPAPWQRLKDEGKIVSVPYSRSKVLFGTIAECLWPFLDESGPPSDLRKVTRADRPYLKYVITKSHSTQHIPPPEELHFAPMTEAHLQTIIDRTNIPRTIETVRQLPNVGLFDAQNVPVAWGLLGKDASLSSLHTEPDYRRKGLAIAIATRLIHDQAALFQDASEAGDNDVTVYSHADVSTSNMASRNVMVKLGGKVLWRVAWIEVQLGED